MFKNINQISEQAYLLDFGSSINKKTNILVINFANHILKDSNAIKYLGISNCVPSYNKILIKLNPKKNNKKELLNNLKSIKLPKLKESNKIKIFEIPICYDKEFALDINYISEQKKISINDIIEIHSSTIFHTYMIGFMPGLPFMGDLSSKLSLSRRLNPRINLSKGSVGIVDKFCVIYPNNSPGGWNIIGRTPIDLFIKDCKNPLVVKPGDRIKFKIISKNDFYNMSKLNE